MLPFCFWVNLPELETDQDDPAFLKGLISGISMSAVNLTGGCGDIFSGKHKTRGKVALKCTRARDEHTRKNFEEEEKVWSRLKQRNVLKLLGTFTYQVGAIEVTFLVSPWAKYSSIRDFITEHPKRAQRIALLAEAATGLAYLHKLGIVHGDIKGNNILVSSRQHAMLCDFGLATHQDSNTGKGNSIGTAAWKAPELFKDNPVFTRETDAWAFGMTIYEVLSNKDPFNGDQGQTIVATRKGKRPPKEPEVSPRGKSYANVWAVAEACWRTDPRTRISVDHAKACLREDRVPMDS
ncbi:hypothetical protein FRB99_002203 [Tulasnella sp. 403]|nr:hypothetical protein FRB99_002203 [Tulasnella sp. 403]